MGRNLICFIKAERELPAANGYSIFVAVIINFRMSLPKISVQFLYNYFVDKLINNANK